jgi:transposase
VLFRLAYHGVTNTLALLRLLPISDRDKDAEILALRHQITVFERQLHGERVHFTRADRAWLAALLHRVLRDVVRSLRMVVHPETVLRWHRHLIAHRHARICRPTRVGRPRTIRSIRQLVLRMARENTSWGYRRIHGELLVLGVKVAASTVWKILHEVGIDPAPQRTVTTWATFLRSQTHAILADAGITVVLSGLRMPRMNSIMERWSQAARWAMPWSPTPCPPAATSSPSDRTSTTASSAPTCRRPGPP